MSKILLPILVLWALAFAVYNPEPVAVNFWPLPYELMAPLSVFTVLVLAVGYWLGAWSGYIKSARLRSEHKQQKKQLEKMESPAAPN